MKTKIFSILALSLIATQGAWAQGKLTPNGDKTVWTLTMPANNILLQAEYYTDLYDDQVIDYSGIQGTKADLWMNRTLQSGGWNTLALPFTMTLNAFKTQINDNSVLVKELTDASVTDNTLTLTFSDAEGIVAGKPYLVKLSGGESVGLGGFDEVTMPATIAPQTIECGSTVEFVATLGKSLVLGSGEHVSDASTVLFLGAGNKLYNAKVVNNSEKVSSYLKGFRAYFRLIGDAAGARASQFVMDFGDEPTIIGEIKGVGQGATANSKWVDLFGRKYNIKPTQKGVYIMDGVKNVIE